MIKTTYLKDGCLFFLNKNSHDTLFNDCLIIDPTNLAHLVNYVNKSGVKSIMINSGYFKVNDLSFLKDIPNIESVKILDDGFNISVLNQLKSLREIRLNNIKQELNFENFPNLEVLSITDSKYVINLNSCKKLFYLWIDKYAKSNLTAITELKNLNFLHLYKPALVNLQGIDALSKLAELHIDTAGKLKSLDGLSETNKLIANIDVYKAPVLENYDALSKVSSLERIRFTKTGEIQSLAFVKQLPNLKTVLLGTKVVDGNMAVLKGISKVDFIDFPHYDLKAKQFKAS